MSLKQVLHRFVSLKNDVKGEMNLFNPLIGVWYLTTLCLVREAIPFLTELHGRERLHPFPIEWTKRAEKLPLLQIACDLLFFMFIVALACH